MSASQVMRGDVRIAGAVRRHRDKRSAPPRAGRRSSGGTAVGACPCDLADDDRIPALGIKDDPLVAARALGSGCEHHQGVIDPWQWPIRASRDCDRVTGGRARAGAPARHHHPARPTTRRERVILSRAERAVEGHDVVLPSARTWPGSSGLGWVPPWPGGLAGHHTGKPTGRATGRPTGLHRRPPEQRKRKSRWVNARWVPERPVHSLGGKDSPAPAPSVSPRASSSPGATGNPERLLERVSGPVRPGTHAV